MPISDYVQAFPLSLLGLALELSAEAQSETFYSWASVGCFATGIIPSHSD